MRASRSERRIQGRLCGLAALFALALATPAAAQLGPPVRLVPPPPSSGPAAAPPLDTGGADTPAPAVAPANSEAQPLPPDVQAMPLAPVDPAWAGTLSAADDALPETLWQGTPRGFVTAALPLLQPTTSPTLQALARRLLLSNAAAPTGEDAARDRPLGALRLDRLVALGHLEGAAAVIDRLHWRGTAEPLDRRRAELGFLRNDTEAACRQVQDAIGRYQDVWWDRAQIACQALSGDQAKAQLGLSLLRERNVPRDQIFDSLVEAIGGRNVKIDRMPDSTPVRVALLAAAKLPLPADALQAAGPAVLRAWATNANVPNDRRLPVAERAAALGAFPLDDLRLVYTEITFKSEDRKSALAQASENPRARAFLYATAKGETVPAARAEALQALLQAGQKRGEFPVAARLVAPLLLDMRPSPDLDWFAPQAARALYAADRPIEARQWVQLGGPAVQAQLFLVARLAQGASGPAWPKDGLGSVFEGLQPKDGGVDPSKSLLAAALLTAVGEPMTPTDWAALVAVPPAPPAPLPNAALWLDGRDAAANQRLGETVLDTLLMAQSGGRLAAEPIVIAEAVARLRAVGLEADARRLAVEAALAAGF